jgi:hypothetical protein
VGLVIESKKREPALGRETLHHRQAPPEQLDWIKMRQIKRMRAHGARPARPVRPWAHLAPPRRRRTGPPPGQAP